MTNYIDVVYDKKRTPVSGYPSELIGYLTQRFNIQKGEKLLEIGCGRGDFLDAFRLSGLEVSGIDRDGSSVKSDSFKVLNCNISNEPLPFEESSMDVVYHKSLIEHLIDPDNLMKETLRVLKKGGKTVILAPDWDSQAKVFYEDYTHVQPYMAEGLEDMLKVYGFKDIVVEKFYQLPVLWKRPYLKFISKVFSIFVTVKVARKITSITGVKWFRFSKETMLLAYGRKD